MNPLEVVSHTVPDEAALSELRHLLTIEMEDCSDSIYNGLERAIEMLDELRESLENAKSGNLDLYCKTPNHFINIRCAKCRYEWKAQYHLPTTKGLQFDCKCGNRIFIEMPRNAIERQHGRE